MSSKDKILELRGHKFGDASEIFIYPNDILATIDRCPIDPWSAGRKVSDWEAEYPPHSRPARSHETDVDSMRSRLLLVSIRP